VTAKRDGQSKYYEHKQQLTKPSPNASKYLTAALVYVCDESFKGMTA
jgi:hypothetical protein